MRPLKETVIRISGAGALVVLPCFAAGSASVLVAGAAEVQVSEDAAAATGKKEAEFRAALERMNEARSGEAILAEVELLAAAFPASREVLLEAARKGSERQRRFAIKILAEEGTTEKDLPVVLPALRDRSNRVRLAAVMATRKFGPVDEALSALMRYMRVEDDANNLKMAVKTLQHWSKEETVPHIVALLEKSDDQGVKNFCVTALRRITGKQYGSNPETWRAYVEAQEALRHEVHDGVHDGRDERDVK